jgi:hypothetical protein
MVVSYSDKQPLLFHFVQLMKHQKILHEFNDTLCYMLRRNLLNFYSGTDFMNKERN